MNKDAQEPLPSDFFVAGGTLPATASSYVSRAADEQLYDLTVAGDFCYVLTTRQMGKSSLMVRTEARLRKRGIRTAILDLTAMGGNTEETWYLDLLTELADQLKLAQDAEEWWNDHVTLGTVRRFSNFLRDVVLREINDQIVVFVDEIDSTLGLPFADNFFAAIRAFYNARAVNTEFNRLTFAFFGVAAPADLIKDRTRTPFNIGEGIELRDFNRSDAAVLQRGLELVYPGQGELILDRIYFWTSGHPYLTQKLCRDAVDIRRSEPWTDVAVDEMVADEFLSNRAKREQNLQFVQDRILKSPQRRGLLRLYGGVLSDRKIPNDEQSTLQNQLKLAGLVKTEGSQLHVHNEIYGHVFNRSWVKENTPRDRNRVVGWTIVAIAVLATIVMGLVLWYNTTKVPEQAQNLQFDFAHTTDTQTRVQQLAELFELQGIGGAPDYDNAARELFFSLGTRQEQLEIFRAKSERMASVIRGLYTALANVDSADNNDSLLRAMADALDDPYSTAPIKNLRSEINHWLAAREKANQNQLQASVDEYDTAINLNPENPATLYERAKVSLALQRYSLASRDLDQVIALARRAPTASATVVPSPTLTTTIIGSTLLPATTIVNTSPTIEPSAVLTVTPSSVIAPPSTLGAGSPQSPTTAPKLTVTLAASSTETPIAPAIVTPNPGPGNTPVPESTTSTAPFKSNFATYVQVFNAVKMLIDKYPSMTIFLALNVTNTDYRNLQENGLVVTLTPTICPIPVSWQIYVVGSFDTLTSIALRFNITVDQLVQANCLGNSSIVVGQTIYVPPFQPTSTFVPIATSTRTTSAVFTPAGISETLVIVADFEDRSGGKYQGIDPAQYIYEQLAVQAKKDGLSMRIERLRQTVDNNTVRPIGETYSATLVLWGWYDALSITPRLERIKIQSDYQSIQEGKHISFADPSEVEFAVVTDLPSQTTYLTLLMLGLDRYAVGQIDEAITYFTGAIASIPSNVASATNPAEAYYFRGNAYDIKGEYGPAIADYTQSLALRPTKEAYIGRGNAFVAQAKYVEAISDYTQAIAIDPQAVEAFVGRANAYRDLGDYERAIAEYDKTIQLQPDYTDSYINRGNAYEAKGDYERAIVDYNKAIQLRPDNTEGYIALGAVYYKQALSPFAVSNQPTDVNQDWLNKSIDAYQLALQSINGAAGDLGAKIHFGLGQAYFMQVYSGHTSTFDASVAEFQSVIAAYATGTNTQVKGLAAESHARLGLIYDLSGHTLESIQEYEIAASLSDDPQRKEQYIQRSLILKKALLTPTP